MTALHAYLQRPRPQSFVRGMSDCASFVAGWMEHVMGHPVNTLALGRALSDTQALRLVTRAGGFAPLVRRVLSGHGWSPVPVPADGDVIVAECSGCYLRTLVGIWSADHAVSIGQDSQLRIVPPHLLTEAQAWRFLQPTEHHGH